MTMILPQETGLEGARQELIDKPLEDYLSMLAREKPFSLEIAAETAQLFDALALNWPQIEGWEKEAAELQRQIRELAEPFIIPGAECHLRVSINADVAPRSAPRVVNVPAVRAAFDVGENTFYYQVLDAHQPGDISFDHVATGLVLLIQPFDGSGEASAVGIG